MLSNPFTVGIGPAAMLILIKDPATAGIAAGTEPVKSGQPLPIQPTVAVYDAGAHSKDIVKFSTL